jgi:hypothetical protein
MRKKYQYFFFHRFSVRQVGHDEKQETSGREQQPMSGNNQALPQRQTNRT